MAAPALPVVALVGERGERAWGLVDTGTWVSLVDEGTHAGRWRLLDGAGRTLLSVVPTATAPWKGLHAGPHPITVWIGLDALEGRTWTMDFTTGVWSFDPVPAAPSGRPSPPSPPAPEERGRRPGQG
jgi:hypothetical protein